MRLKNTFKNIYEVGTQKANDFVSSYMKDKKGVMGLDVAQKFVVGLLSLVIIGVLVIIVLNSLNSSSVSTTDTTFIVGNTSEAVRDLFENTGTWLTLVAVVIIILIIAAVIVVVNRFGGSSKSL